MRWRWTMLVGASVLLVIAVASVHASFEDGTVPEDELAAAEPEGAHPTECPYDLRDFQSVRMYAEGVTREMVAESARLQAELAERAGPLTAEEAARQPPSAEQLLANACAAHAAEALGHHRRLLGRPPEEAPPLPDGSDCGRFCSLYASCGGPAPDTVDRDWNCLDECLAGHFGRQYWVQRVADLRDCRYL